MKYYSELIGKTYDTAGECIAAENEYKAKKEKEKIEKEKKANERKTRATEVEDARKAMIAAQSKYRELLEAFCKDYGTYHQTLTDKDVKGVIPSLFDIFNPLFFDFK